MNKTFLVRSIHGKIDASLLKLSLLRNKKLKIAKYSPFYFFATEDIKDTINEYNHDDRILTVLSSGDHVFNYLAKGASNIETFDVNPLTLYAFKLKRTMIENLSYDEFVRCISLPLFDIFEKMRFYNLEEDVFSFYDSLYKNNISPENFEESRVSSSSFIQKANSYLADENIYNKVKYKLKDGLKIPFYCTDISSLSDCVDGTFSEINLSNILFWKGDIITGLYNLVPSLDLNLKPGGKILFYKFCGNDFKYYTNLIESLSPSALEYKVIEFHSEAETQYDVSFTYTKKKIIR